MNKPMMRFSGFDDEWVEKKLGDVVDLLTSSLRAKDLEIDGEYPVYDANDLIGYHSTCLSDREYISIIKDGAGVGRMRSLNGHTNITSTMNGLLPNKNFDSNYVVQSLDMVEFDKYVIGTTIPHIYYKDYKSEVLLVPKSLPEQKLIGNFFKAIDDLISAQEETVEAYKQYKEGMLQKMFPKKGKNLPEVRFDGFDDEWEEKKLGDVVDLLTSSLRAKDLEIDGEYPVYDANDLIGYHSTCLSDREYISIIKDGAGVGRMRSLNGHTNITSTMNGLLPNKNFDSNYVVQTLDMIEFDKYVIGTTIPHIYYKDYKSEVLLVPKSLPEQKLIGNFFKNLDDTIESHKEKLEIYQQMKESLLQKMFV